MAKREMSKDEEIEALGREWGKDPVTRRIHNKIVGEIARELHVTVKEVNQVLGINLLPVRKGRGGR